MRFFVALSGCRLPETQSGGISLECKDGYYWLISEKDFLVDSKMKCCTIFKLVLF